MAHKLWDEGHSAAEVLARTVLFRSHQVLAEEMAVMPRWAVTVGLGPHSWEDVAFRSIALGELLHPRSQDSETASEQGSIQGAIPGA